MRYLLPLVLLGCVGEELGEIDSDLNLVSSLRWPGSPPLIGVCWENPTPAPPFGDTLLAFLDDGTTIDEPTLRAWARETVESQWSRNARVNFTQWDTCTPGEPGVHILIKRRGGSASEIGPGSAGITHMEINLFLDDDLPWCRANRAQFEICEREIPLHEFGHALGFLHQENRPDYVATDPHPDCASQDDGGADQLLGGYDIASVMSYCGQKRDEPWTRTSTLSPTDVASLQLAYGRRIPGTLVGQLGADALATNLAPATPALVFDAVETPSQLWTYDFSKAALQTTRSGQPVCLDGDAARGELGMDACTTDPSQNFTFTGVALRGFGGLCLEVPLKQMSSGAPARLAKCSGDVNQRWTLDKARRARLAGTDLCLTASTAVGTQLVIADCGSTATQSFVFSFGGRLAFGKLSSRCIDAEGPSRADLLAGSGLVVPGARVVTAACSDDRFGQLWHIAGPVTDAYGRCVTAPDLLINGSAATLTACTRARAQDWDFYW